MYNLISQQFSVHQEKYILDLLYLFHPSFRLCPLWQPPACYADLGVCFFVCLFVLREINWKESIQSCPLPASSQAYRQNSQVSALSPNSVFLGHSVLHLRKWTPTTKHILADPNYKTLFSSLTTFFSSLTRQSPWKNLPPPALSHQGLTPSIPPPCMHIAATLSYPSKPL